MEIFLKPTAGRELLPRKCRLKSFIILSRPLNVLIGMLSIFLGAGITGTIQPFRNVILACLSGGLITGAANAINDFYDVAIDRINKPYRPIPAGTIRPREGLIFSIILFVVGIALAYFINRQAFIISFISVLILVFYSAKLKRTILWGNLTVSLITALAFIFGGVAVNRFGYALIPAVFAFFYILGREIIKDTEDVVGDRADRIQTLPIRYGEKFALKVASWIYIILILLTTIPYAIKIFGIYYLVSVIGIVDLVMVYVIISMTRNSESKNLARLSLILKLNMFAGLAAIYLGRF